LCLLHIFFLYLRSVYLGELLRSSKTELGHCNTSGKLNTTGFSQFRKIMIFFLICIRGGGVQLGPLGTAATNRPIVSTPGDYDDAEICGMIGRGNRSTRKKPAPMLLCPPQTPTCCTDANPGRRGGKPATNRLSYCTA
jgi:hypothetical protein